MSTMKKQFLALLVLSLVGIVSIYPYALTLQAELLADAPLPLPVIILAGVVQSTLLVALLTWVGLRCARATGIKLPLLTSIIETRKLGKSSMKTLGLSMLLGVITGAAIIFIDWIFSHALGSFETSAPPAWQGFLASFYGGIVEEIIMRLFLLSFLLWIFTKLTKLKKYTPVQGWVAILLVALAFGAGHLPAMSTITALTPPVIARVFVLNGLGGVVFGWLYLRRGLLAAMLAHFMTDIVLHVIFASLQ